MSENQREVCVWIDADACPKAIKELLFRAADRRKIKTTLVANHSLSKPNSPYIFFVRVEKGFDVADHYIIQHVSKYDIVITSDIPLAALVIDKGALAINPRGRLFTEENIRERLSVRNFMENLRNEGVQTGGPSCFGSKQKQQFANTFDRVLTQKLNELLF